MTGGEARAILEIARQRAFAARRLDLADDIAQATVERILRFPPSFQMTSGFLWTVASWCLFDLLKNDAMRARHERAVADIYYSAPPFRIRELRIDLERALASLTKDERDCVHAAEQHGELVALAHRRGRHPSWGTRNLRSAGAKLREALC